MADAAGVVLSRTRGQWVRLIVVAGAGGALLGAVFAGIAVYATGTLSGTTLAGYFPVPDLRAGHIGGTAIVLGLLTGTLAGMLGRPRPVAARDAAGTGTDEGYGVPWPGSGGVPAGDPDSDQVEALT